MYKRERHSWLKHLDFTIMDIFCIQLAYVIAYWIRFRDGLPYFNDWYERLAVVIVFLQICIVFFTEPYKDVLRRNKFQELKKVLINSALIFFAAILYIYSTKLSEAYARTFLYIFFAVSVPICYVAHLFLKKIVRDNMVQDKNRSIMLLLTTSDAALSTIRGFEKNRYRNFVVKGIVMMDKDCKGEVIRDVPVVAGADDFMDYIRNNIVDEAFIDCNDIAVNEKLSKELLEMGLIVHIKVMHESAMMSNRVVEKCADFMVLTSSMNIASPRQLFIKRVTDIIGSLVGMIFMFIALIIFAPIIKIQSPGPVFYSQIRVGKNGRRFKLYKFRSMYLDADKRKAELMAKNEMDGLMFKMEDDPRIIPIGKFMRKYSIDELPQFWNILKGDMSLVGTRPPTEDEYVQYEAHHRARLGIKPGLTGMWQVSGRSNITNFEDVVALDTEYISNWNLSLDMGILLKTIVVVFKGSGAS